MDICEQLYLQIPMAVKRHMKKVIQIAITCAIFYWTLEIYRYGHKRGIAQNCAFDATESNAKEFSNYISFPDNKPLKLQCSTCAFVTGSGHLLGSKKGLEIDSMDCVFRSNDAPTNGFEEDVGTKTTVRLVDRTSLAVFRNPFLRYIKGFRLDELYRCSPSLILSLFYPPEIRKEFEITHQYFPHLQLYAGTEEVYEKTSEIYRKRVTPVKGAWWSNGFTTIYIAHELCDVVHVYGINDEDYCKHVLANEPGYKDVPYHYYARFIDGKNCNYLKSHDRRKTKAHSFTKEKDLFKKLTKEWGNLHFHAPEWPE